MTFLVKKSFLKSNEKFTQKYQARMNLTDMIWAGQNVEPRILEVLPSAAARLPKSFIFDSQPEILQLQKIVNQLNQNCDHGDDFFNIPYQKIKQWMNLPLNDQRTKIKLLKLKDGISEAAVLERLLAKESA